MIQTFQNYSPTTILDYDPWIVVRPTVLTTPTVIYRRRDYTYGNEPIVLRETRRETRRERAWARDDQARFERLELLIKQFGEAAEAEAARRLRVSRETNRKHIRESRLFAPPPLVEAMFHRPTFFRRACGGRWRVMAA